MVERLECNDWLIFFISNNAGAKNQHVDFIMNAVGRLDLVYISIFIVSDMVSRKGIMTK